MAGGPTGVRRVVHRARRAVLERTARPGTEPVDLSVLITPLRYDVVVRARLFDLLAERPDLTGDALVRAASATAYADWFVHVECARFFPELLQDEAARDERFAERVHGAARLLRSVEARGFDPASPVTLLRAPAGTVSESGAPALGDLHIGDGCPPGRAPAAVRVGARAVDVQGPPAPRAARRQHRGPAAARRARRGGVRPLPGRPVPGRGGPDGAGGRRRRRGGGPRRRAQPAGRHRRAVAGTVAEA